MAHDHHHHDENTYYVDQLFTIAVCGALGAVAALMYTNNKLGLILHPKFHAWVLAGGIALLALVAVRAVALWFEVDKPVDFAHEHSHDHDHAHDHDHGCCGHDHSHEHAHAIKEAPSTAVSSLPVVAAAPAVHDHGHDHHDHDHDHAHDHDHGHSHAWSPWRYVVLILPAMLYLLNLPNDGLRGHTAFNDLGQFDPPKVVASTGTDYSVGFTQLEQAATTEEGRAHMQGKTVRLTGRFYSYDTKRFTLVKYKITCCAADARPIDVVLMVDPASKEQLDNGKLNRQWAEVTGRVQFLYNPQTQEYKTAVIVYPTSEHSLKELIKVIPPDPNPYVT